MPCSRLHGPPYQLSDSRRIGFLQVRPKYTQRAYPEGKLKSAVVMRSLSSLGRYIRGLGARPRIRAVVVISLMSGYITWRSYRLPSSPMWYLGWSKVAWLNLQSEYASGGTLATKGYFCSGAGLPVWVLETGSFSCWLLQFTMPLLWSPSTPPSGVTKLGWAALKMWEGKTHGRVCSQSFLDL